MLIPISQKNLPCHPTFKLSTVTEMCYLKKELTFGRGLRSKSHEQNFATESRHYAVVSANFEVTAKKLDYYAGRTNCERLFCSNQELMLREDNSDAIEIFLKGSWHGQKLLHLFVDSEAYHVQMVPIPSSNGSLDIALSNAPELASRWEINTELVVFASISRFTHWCLENSLAGVH